MLSGQAGGGRNSKMTSQCVRYKPAISTKLQELPQAEVRTVQRKSAWREQCCELSPDWLSSQALAHVRTPPTQLVLVLVVY